MRVDVEDLTCRRSGRVVLDRVSLSLTGGAVLVLRGPNGAGKTTLLRALAGLLPIERGTLRIDGADQARNGDAYAEKVVYAGHLDAIKPQLTVAENLAFWGTLFGEPDVAPALAAFDLAAIAERPAHACSAGQKRRLGLARLLVSPARPLWLLDEPTVSLDAASNALLMGRIRTHVRDGGAAIVATHVPLDLPDARTFELSPAASRASKAFDPFLADLVL
jgi:heme exporter protein A